MGVASFFLGLLSMIGVCVALIPFLNLLNCINLPLAALGVLLGLIDVLSDKLPGQSRTLGIVGLAMSTIALVVGGIRFYLSVIGGLGIL